VCDFCEELSGCSAGEFGRRHPGAEARVVWADDDFALLPTLGPLTRGHALVVPRPHVTSFAALAETSRRAAERLVMRLALRARACGDDIIWFEHGSSRPGSSGGCGVVHAHLHIVPVRQGWRRPALPPDFAFRRVTAATWLDLPGFDRDYLLIGQLDDVWVAPVARIPSQTLRRWLAPAVGATSWDWRSCGPDPGLAEDVDSLRAATAAA
jgi:diadenosine tetraphosphate (Ap4A) HIT family hydrolase